MGKKTWFWIVLFALVVLGGVGVYCFRGGGTVATVWLDGEVIETIDLSAVAIPYDFTVSSEYGTNVIHVEHGAISVSESDCANQICVNQGSISSSAIPITCLPHRLVIQIEDE